MDGPCGPEGYGRLTAAGCIEWGDGPSGRGWWYRPAGDEYKVRVTCFPSRGARHSERSEESRYLPIVSHWLVNASRREGAACHGQPSIGRPLIGQARGQLRLTWRSYAGPPQLLPLWCLTAPPSPPRKSGGTIKPR